MAGRCNLFGCDEKKSCPYEYITQGTSGLVTLCLVKTRDVQLINYNKKQRERFMTIDEIKHLNLDGLGCFADLARDKLPMPGNKKRLEEILNKNIIILDYRINKSNKRENSECLQMQFMCDGEVYVTFTGSVVLIDQIKAVKDKLPLKTIIIKVDKYYSFS